ncbi:MAG: hypothetical protein IGBAC_1607 [Ignavibacteriae bacterium]|nr:MAG: hypothetical protein IGBAC_1607 [Ignavibacteriota bacterium]
MVKYVKIFLKTFKNSFRLFTTLLFLNILELSLAQAQRITPYFSTISEIPIYRGNQNLLVGDFNGDGFQDVCSYGNGIISIIYNSENLEWKIKYIETDSKNFIATVDDINSDDITDILYLDPTLKQLRVYLGSRNDTIINKWRYKLEDSYSKIITADINNDGKKDIILFGKKNLGLTVLTGRGDGTFRYPQNILQDYFFSDVLLCNCSEDDIPDIFAVSWIDNKLLYFTSYAPMKYLSPSIISFNNEPVSFKTFYLNDDDFIDIIILLEDRQTIMTYLGDNLGNFIFKDKLSLPFKIDKYFLTDANQLLNNSLIVFNKQNNLFAVLTKNNSSKFKEEVVYSIGADATDFDLYQPINSDTFHIVVSSEKNKKLYLLQNALISYNITPQTKYLTMPFPDNIFSYNLNNDGYTDIILSSNGDYYSSLYTNNSQGRFSGMINLKGFPKNINSLFFSKYIDNKYYAITTHNSVPSVNLSILNPNDLTSVYYPVSGIPNPELQYIKTRTDGGIEFFLSSYENDSRYVNLYYYKQLEKYKFFEKSINSFGGNIVGITMIDLNDDDYPDYLYLKRNYKNTIALIGSILDSNYNIIRNKKYFEIQDTSSTRYLLIKKDLNNDNYQDLIFYSPDKLELSLSLYNPIDSLYTKPHQKFDNIKLSSTNGLQFCDFDLNDKIDLIIGNLYTQTLQVYFNHGDGKFSSPETIMGIYEINSFLANDFNYDSLIDIALVYKDGFLKIIYGQK